MKFYLDFSIAPAPFKIYHHKNIMLIGSCFSDEIGSRLASLKFNVQYNHCGIVYDPLSMARQLNSIMHPENEDFDLCFSHNDIFHHPNYHSVFSSLSKDELIKKIKNSLHQSHEFLKQSTHLILTFGSAYYHTRVLDNKAVSNCHKLPSAEFKKKLGTIAECLKALETTIHTLLSINPTIKLIFTISPVRHIKDGLIENNRSKSRLLEIVHSLVETFENSYYFPSYELVYDVLRDYRFYKEDLVHPNSMAIDVIFDKFLEACIDNSDHLLIEKIISIRKDQQHRSLFPGSIKDTLFNENILLKISEIEKEYPYIRF